MSYLIQCPKCWLSLSACFRPVMHEGMAHEHSLDFQGWATLAIFCVNSYAIGNLNYFNKLLQDFLIQ